MTSPLPESSGCLLSLPLLLNPTDASKHRRTGVQFETLFFGSRSQDIPKKCPVWVYPSDLCLLHSSQTASTTPCGVSWIIRCPSSLTMENSSPFCAKSLSPLLVLFWDRSSRTPTWTAQISSKLVYQTYWTLWWMNVAKKYLAFDLSLWQTEAPRRHS